MKRLLFLLSVKPLIEKIKMRF